MDPSASPRAWTLARPPRIVIVGPGDKPGVAEAVESYLAAAAPLAEEVAVDLCFSMNLEDFRPDLAIVVGGDGSILRAARQLGRQQIPMVGVNLGKLGFLADLQPGELNEVLPKILAGQGRVVEHLMFECHVLRGDHLLASQLGLNEVALRAGTPFSMVHIRLYIDAELVTTYSCDGLIVSTPVGSTAYNLSAGGPILRKDLQAFVISPLSSHSLTNRPVVDRADRVYELEVRDDRPETYLVVDGVILSRLTPSDRVRVHKADSTFQLIQVPGHTYYRTLREKLGWGGGILAP